MAVTFEIHIRKHPVILVGRLFCVTFYSVLWWEATEEKKAVSKEGLLSTA